MLDPHSEKIYAIVKMGADRFVAITVLTSPNLFC